MKEQNFAFIDWQNLYLWTKEDNWKIDLYKFRRYLREKYNIEKAYYFLWSLVEDNEKFYDDLQDAWFILKFREHSSKMMWKKKWNVDTDIVYNMLVCAYENYCDKILLVSWDWDYIKTVRHLIKMNKFIKVIFPNRKYSSLYKSLTREYYDILLHLKNKIQYSK